MTASMRIPIAKVLLVVSLLAGALAGLGALTPAAVGAATPTIRCVTTSGGPPPATTASGCGGQYGTIGAAIAAAAAGDTIYVFADAGATAASPTTYAEHLNITKSLTIVGVGAVAVDGGGSGRTFSIDGGTTTLIGLTITGGDSNEGGGIYDDFFATLTLIGVTVSGNTAGNYGHGGGIFTEGVTLTLIDSTVANNTAPGGFGGGILANGTLTLVHSTVAGNSATEGADGYGGGIYGGATLTDSIVAGNSAGTNNPASAGGNGPDISSLWATVTNNASVVGDATGLGTLADNGGPTQTVSIGTTSPAYHNAACATDPATGAAVATDQRGAPRPANGASCSAGAFEPGAAVPAFPVRVATQTLPDAATSTAYSQALATTGGAAPYTYSLLAGSLPTGIALSPSGALSGSPSQTGAFPFTVGVADAGGFRDIRALTLNVVPPDTTKPVLTAHLSGTPGSNGWYTSNVSVTFTCADEPGGSGLATPASGAYGDTTLTNDGANQAVTSTGSCTDKAGNIADAATASGINIDKTAPTGVSGSPARPADSNGWYNHAVTVTFTGTDATSGLPATGACTTGASYSSPDSATASVPGSCTDNAGNVGQGSFGPFKYDATKPMVAYGAHPATYTADQTVSITCTAADATSGLASTTCQNIGAPAYTFAVGPNTVSTTATDNAGNTGTGQTSFTVTVNATAIDAVIAKLVTDPSVAATLQQQADAIASAPNAGAKANKLQAFINAVQAQTGKSITQENATILINLAKAL